MRKLSHLAAAALTIAAAPAFAQTTADGVPIIVPSQSSIYNQNSVNLPSPPMVHGQDTVRGVSGASCQSAVAGGGPYLDLGVIGSQDVFNRDTAAVYGRIVVPLGERPKRIDCTRLYDLEIARLKMELDLMRLGMPVRDRVPAAVAPSPSKNTESPNQTVYPPRAERRVKSKKNALAVPSQPATPNAPDASPSLKPPSALTSVMPASAEETEDCACNRDGQPHLREGGPV